MSHARRLRREQARRERYWKKRQRKPPGLFRRILSRLLGNTA